MLLLAFALLLKLAEAVTFKFLAPRNAEFSGSF
jgi:hypothetical protein